MYWLLPALVFVAACGGCESVPDQVNSDLDFLTETPSFANYADELPGWELGAEEAVRLFGAEAVCVPGSDPCRLTAIASAWVDDVNETLKHGHSEGLALATLAFHLHKVEVADFGVENVASLSLNDPKLMREIAFWAATQKIPGALKGDRSFQAKDVMPFLAKALQPGQGEAWRLAVVMKDEKGFRGGHALVPFGYFKGLGDGEYVLRVWDSNWPGKERRLRIDTIANSWSYEGAEDDAAPRTYRGNSENGNLLYFSPLTAHVGPFEAPFSASASSLVVAANGAGVMLKDEAGAEVGFASDGKLVENGGAVRPAFAQSRCVLCPGPAEIVNYTLSPDGGSGGKQTISLEDFGNNSVDGGTVNITGAGVSASLTGVRTEEGGALISVEDQKMTYSSSESSTPTTLTATFTNSDGSTTTVTVALSGSPTGTVEVDASDPNDVKTVIRNQDGETITGTVTVTTTTGDGGTQTTSAGVEVAEGKTSTATIDPATGTSSVFPAPGTACDNNRLDTTLADGGTTGAETDIDCGGLCLKCKERAACKVSADCLSGVCAAGRCQAPTCFDSVQNGDELDVDCGGSCFGTCKPGQKCRGQFDCAATQYGSICYQGSGADSYCQAKKRQQLSVKGLGQGSAFNLNGTVIDAQTFGEWRVTGGATSPTNVTFDAYRYQLKLGSDQPAPYQGNFSCTLKNPTNDPALIALGGNGDGGQPELQCTRDRSSMVVKATGCYGMTVPVESLLDGAPRTQNIAINGVSAGFGTEGVGSLELGSFATSGRFASPAATTALLKFDTVGGVARRQTCPTASEWHYANENKSVFEINYDCACATGDFRGSTASGDPCATAQVLNTLTQDQFVTLNGNTATSSYNDFVFKSDAGCGGNPNPASSGSDKAVRVTVPAGLDLISTFTPAGGAFKGYLSLITDPTSCGNNGPNARTNGTDGARCTSSSKPSATGISSVRYYNNTGANKAVYIVVDGADMGDQGPYTLDIAAVTHSTTVNGFACSGTTALGVNSSVSGQINTYENNIIFSSASTGCIAATPPDVSPNDVTYAMSVPAQTRLTVELGTATSVCAVTGHLVRAASCGTNGATAAQTGTTGLSCVASDYPRPATVGCTRRPLVYDNKSSSSEVVYLVIEAVNPGSKPGYSLTTRTGPIVANSVSTTSGPAYEGNPCDSAPLRTTSAKDDILSQANNFYVLSSNSCTTNAASNTPSGSDAVVLYRVPASKELLVKAEGIYPFVGHVPFFMHAVVGNNNCGQNASDFLDAGTVGMVCDVSGPAGSSAYLNPRTLRYVNASGSSQDVYVVFDAVSSSPDGIRYIVDATISAATIDAGTGGQDAGQDAGSSGQDAGQDAGSGGQDAGQDSGTPDAGPPPCSLDSQCASTNCYCASDPGNCPGNTGRCLPGKVVISTPTDGVASSGTLTIPNGCTQVHVSAWGAGGGKSSDMFGMFNPGGPGGYVSGLITVAPGDVITAWVGRGGQNNTGIIGDEGLGSYFGVSANGGAPEIGAQAGGGGGLTSIRRTGSGTLSFTVPAGSGAGMSQPGKEAGGMGAGSNTSYSGGDAQAGSSGGAGGAGENGGLGAVSFGGPGDPGAYGSLASGLTSQNGVAGFPNMLANPAQTGSANYALCPSDTGTGSGGNGCVVLRCTTP